MTDRLPDLADVLVESLKLAKRLNQSVHLLPSTAESILAELRTRPAEPQGLTAEEREALQWTKALVERVDYDAPGKSTRTALAVLDRLIGGMK